ncbi:MFS transporter [Sphingomonas sp.]|jgi:MFS family permease|uniref:MFS transporter n=1 Tax=Sphingomonas sp. TaxID=28214 RepID=UPI002E13F6E8|nr:MFS transporter [Sphingomonas sp.]
MLSAMLSVRSLLLAIFMLMAGSGFLATLTSVRLERAGSSALFIGVVGTAYFLGLVIGSLRVSRLIRRVGHIRAFAAFVSLFSASTLTYAIHQDPVLWAGLRFVDGLCVAGVFVCLESWLNERAEARSRGSVLASYMIALYAGQAIGQFLLNLSETKPSMPFLVASILISLAAIPVVLTRISAPPPDEGTPLSIRRLYATSPLGIVGATLTGVMLGAFYALGAVHVRRLGMDLSETALFMSIVILGGIALQWPLGRLSDRFDRRRVIVVAFGGALAASIALALIDGPGPLLLTFGALFGGLSFALYPLCVAHTNDHLAPEERVAASGGLVLLYSIGAAMGPLAGAMAMTLIGPSGLFAVIGACAGMALAFGAWRQLRGLPVPAELQQSYQVLPRTTPMAAALDPLASDRADSREKP